MTRIQQVRKEAMENIGDLWDSVKTFDGSDVYSMISKKELVAAVDSSMDDLLKAVVEVQQSMREIHKHNSIPSYEGDLEEGCVTCIQNHSISDLSSRITQALNEKEI